MPDKDFVFKNGDYSFSISEGSVITSIVVPGKDKEGINVVNKAQSLVFETKDGVVNFLDWQIRHEDDGFTLHSVSSIYEIWARYSLTATGVFSIRCKIFCSEDKDLSFSNKISLNLTGCESVFKLERQFNQERGFIRFCHIKQKDSGILVCGYTDLPVYKESELNIETCTNPTCSLKAGQIFESSTSYSFSVV